MNRTELINLIARKTKITHRQFTRDEVTHFMDIMLEIFEDQLTRPDGEIRLGKLGVFEVQRRIRRGGSGQLKNIHTGEAIKTPKISFHIRFQQQLN